MLDLVTRPFQDSLAIPISDDLEGMQDPMGVPLTVLQQAPVLYKYKVTI
jgi:hypothetical protein